MLDGLIKNLNLGDKGGDLVGLVTQQLNAMGGIQGLLSKFQSAGLGDKAASWVGTGQNQAISPEEAGQALGPDAIGQIAAKLGISQEQAGQAVSQALPEVVDKLTPGGQAPAAGQDLMGMIGGLMGGKTGGLDVGGMLGGLLGGDKKP